jgi:hypothetical protein
MRHRSSRPVLDRLLRQPAPGVARRGALITATVAGVGVLGVTAAAPLIGETPDRRSVAVDSPVATASWSVATPHSDRETRPSRSGERSGAPKPVDTREPSPTGAAGPVPGTEQASPTSQDSPSRSRTPRRSPSPTQPHTPRAEDTTAPDTSATTAEVEDDVWTITSDSDEDGSFECALDDEGFEPCDETESFDDLDEGEHRLQVRAVDEAGNVDPSPIELVTDITDLLDD